MRLIDADQAKLRAVELDNYVSWDLRAVLSLLDSAPTIAPPPNDPLPLEQLREMDGEPVWIGSCQNEKRGNYVILDGYDQVLHCLRVIGGGLLDCTTMGKTWMAYRRKPEENE